MYVSSSQIQLFPPDRCLWPERRARLTWDFAVSVRTTAFFPALSIVLVTFGLGAGNAGSDDHRPGRRINTTLAKVQGGWRPRYILLPIHDPQPRSCRRSRPSRLKIGMLVAGQVLVERIFAYNGMGKLLYGRRSSIRISRSSRASAFVIILVTALAVFLVDLIYPADRPAHPARGRSRHDRARCRHARDRRPAGPSGMSARQVPSDEAISMSPRRNPPS